MTPQKPERGEHDRIDFQTTEYRSNGDGTGEREEPHQNECRYCGVEIDPEIARVIGDNDGCVPRCKHCADCSVTGNNNGFKLTAAAAHREREGI